MVRVIGAVPPDSGIPADIWNEFFEIYKEFKEIDERLQVLEVPETEVPEVPVDPTNPTEPTTPTEEEDTFLRVRIAFADSPYQAAAVNQIIEVDDSLGEVLILMPLLTSDPEAPSLDIEITKIVESNQVIKVSGNGRNINSSPFVLINFKGTAARFRRALSSWIIG